MSIRLDHLILHVNDLDASAAFYSSVLGFSDEGADEPFRRLRAAPDLVIQLAPWGTQGGTHLAFALERSDFDRVFETLKREGIAYGDSFESVGNGEGPGEEAGARGVAPTLYFFDPDRHLLEIRCYEG